MTMPEKKETFILYGASFNPPHMGHFSAISQMLENYDKVIVFPYPHKHDSGRIEKILPLKHRMKMLEIFLAEFFPKIHDRLILANLSSEIKLQDKIHEGVFHTYDYLKLVQNLFPEGKISVCLGLDAKDKLNFTHEDAIKKEFGIFYLEEETEFNSRDIRAFFINKKYIRSNKDEDFLKYCLGHSLTQHILTNNIYELKYRKKNKIMTNTKTTKNATSSVSSPSPSTSSSVATSPLDENNEVINVDKFLNSNTSFLDNVVLLDDNTDNNSANKVDDSSTKKPRNKRKM
jgi:cytidyltransferase-like protein